MENAILDNNDIHEEGNVHTVPKTEKCSGYSHGIELSYQTRELITIRKEIGLIPERYDGATFEELSGELDFFIGVLREVWQRKLVCGLRGVEKKSADVRLELVSKSQQRQAEQTHTVGNGDTILS